MMKKRAERAFRAAGTAVVLACIALPLVLANLAVSTEEAATREYIRALALRPGSSVSLVSMSGVQTHTQSRLLYQHYYFVSGCVASAQDCARVNTGNWGEYYAELRALYVKAAMAAPREQTPSFDEWAKEHTHFIVSQIAPAGAQSIAQALREDKGNGDIHMVGTSAGGAAIFSYLSQSMRGEIPLDRRIRSVITVDSPLGRQPSFAIYDLVNGVQASSMKSDVQPGIGEWARAAGIAILTVDTRQDLVSYDPLPGVANDANPIYPQKDTPPAPPYVKCSVLPCQIEYLPEFLDLGSTWHIYTGSHMAVSAREFIDEHWR